MGNSAPDKNILNNEHLSNPHLEKLFDNKSHNPTLLIVIRYQTVFCYCFD